MKLLLTIACAISLAVTSTAQSIIADIPSANTFSIKDARIYVDKNDHALVKIAASLLQKDIEAVSGKQLPIINSLPASGNLIIIGSTDKSSITKKLAKKLDTKTISKKWEAYQIQTLKNPFKGIRDALVITGSDRRGTAFGVFEFSKQIGVSPWYWWADVPVKKKNDLFIKTNVKITDAPKVKYRGLFINDEAPALSGWSKEKFGGFNHLFYRNVFELMLRLKSNYLWPAMWGNAFYDDDSLNIKTADDYGIVIGTSHHEPLMRAHDEWRRYGNKKLWNYDSTEAELKEFWRDGMKRAWNEKIVSVGMRGDGDEPMSRETATALLERIVKDQRKIIEEVTGKPASETPQLWALYKEVQDYYDKGMRVPDDVTLLLCDDNWGNIRKLPKLDEKPRKGGYGIYYHFDYVGGPRNYKWINTNPLPRIWEQMHLAYEYKARQIWIVNVGDIKPMEFPISFWCDYAWNPEKIGADDLKKYTEDWAADQFGNKYAKEIAEIISKYSKYNGRRKPELLDANTYSIDNYNEAQRVTKDYNDLLAEAEKINEQLPEEYRDAYFQLVLHPVKASANLQEMYTEQALNITKYLQNDLTANTHGRKVIQLYRNDSIINNQYHLIKGGKWNHMMDQTHIGYTFWQQPPVQKMPDVRFVANYNAIDPIPNEGIKEITSELLVPATSKGNIFYEISGFVSMEAAHFTNAINESGVTWKVLPEHGKTGDAITTFPVTAPDIPLTNESPHLEYEFYSNSSGKANLALYFSPTLNFHNDGGLLFAVSVDDENPQVINLNKNDIDTRTWEKWVAANIIKTESTHTINSKGKHVIKFWMMNSGIVLQKLVLDFGGVKPSYLGPPETLIQRKK
ncbi:MAG TPA: glycosyl hydrolase 115 family protein [Chitinophagaceae bacterium]|nr:glycosyl hydrolase 115 family protein [Chitinophagaceae bacterium]